MKFDNTEKPSPTYAVFDEGVYEFLVLDAQEQISKTGNDMMKLKLEFKNANNEISTVFDYLVAPYPKKIAAFSQTTNLLDKYEAGELTPTDCMNKKGYALLEIQEYEYEKFNIETQEMEKLKGKNNKVKFYKPAPEKKEEVQARDELIDDDVPF